MTSLQNTITIFYDSLPYHPELKPIELIWATVKNWVTQNNTTFKMDDVIKLADQKFASIKKFLVGIYE
jgi:transposase